MMFIKTPRDSSIRPISPRGFTLIELLTVIGIISTLLAFLVPAVLDSRHAALGLQCSNNLRQLEFATLLYHDAFNEYPAYFRSGKGVAGQTGKYYSVFSRIAPFFEQVSLYNNINFQVKLYDTASMRQDSAVDLTFASPANMTVMSVSLPIFFCPADPAERSQGPCVGTNYRANYGANGGHGWDLNLSGPFTLWSSTSASHVTDGLSQTASFSEKPRGDIHRTSFNSFVDPLINPHNTAPPEKIPFEYCDRQQIIPANYRTTTGINWLVGSLTQTCYNHMETPNSDTPDCIRLVYQDRVRSTARSYHGTGANVAMADGSVHFVRATINPRVWVALGTRAGQEVIPDDGW